MIMNNTLNVTRHGSIRIAAAAMAILTLAALLPAAATEDLLSKKRLRTGGGRCLEPCQGL